MPLRVDDLRLQPSENAQVLCVALETADVGGHLVEGAFPVVPVGRMPDVVGQTGQFDQVGVAADTGRDPPPDLSDLQRVRQPRPRGIALARPDDLRLVRKPA